MNSPEKRRVNLAIGGMHCTSCALLIRRSLLKIPGVSEVNVNYASEKASVITVKPDEVNKLMSAVRQAGYTAALIDEKTKGDDLRRQEKEIRDIKNRFLTAALLSVPIMFLPQWIGLVLATPVQFLIGKGFYRGAWSALKMKTFSMDSLVVIGTTVTYLYSLINLVTGKGEVFFETSALLITFVTLGKWLESRAKSKTSEAIRKLTDLRPVKARIIKGTGYEEVNTEDIKTGDILLVKPGERVPIDGVITKGTTTIDESMLTGESLPVDKITGDRVTGGTINQMGGLEFRVTETGEKTFLNQIIKLVEEAQDSKAPIQDFADRVAALFVPAVLIISGITFVIWYIFLGATFTYALLSLVSVIVIACPCALGLATPTAIIVGVGRGAQSGILIKGGEPLETAGKINTLIFDKTGTLTAGHPEVTEIKSQIASHKSQDILEIAGSLEKQSEHPLGKAIYEYALKNKAVVSEVSNFKIMPGTGIRGKIGGKEYILGKTDNQNPELIKMENDGQTVMTLSRGNKIIGLIAVADKIKPESREAVKQLEAMGIVVYMISGDKQKTAEAIARQAGISHVLGEIKPDGKAAEIEWLQKSGKTVAMVGDGINDAPALAAADLGIVMGSGTDVAMESGSVVLLKNNPLDAVKAIKLSKITLSKIKQNMFLALIYNILGIPIAARVFAGLGLVLRPELAGLAMAMSSVSVVTNSLLLKKIKI